MDIRLVAGCNFVLIFVRHFLLMFAHVRCLTLFRAGRTRLGMRLSPCSQVGDTFSSYKELKEHLEEFKRINFVQLIQRDSRTLSAAAKRAPKVVEKANKELLYYTIVLSYVAAYLEKHKSEGSGMRPRQKCVLNNLSYAYKCTSLCYNTGQLSNIVQPQLSFAYLKTKAST